MSLAPRVVLVYRNSELEELTARHSTRGQVEFFLRQRGRTLAQTESAHEQAQAALREVAAAVPADWRRADVERADLPQFLFSPEDIVAVVGRDGLVANVAKYVSSQPVVGFNPFPTTNAGVLTPWAPLAAGPLLHGIATGAQAVSSRSMVEAVSDDGQRIRGLNDLYIGHPRHQSAVYDLLPQAGQAERQSSSGVVVGTGTGATGWLASLAESRGRADLLPAPSSAQLAWFVREAWPSPFTGTTQTEGNIGPGERLRLTVQSDALVTFGDGIEADNLEVGFGQTLSIGIAESRLNLVAPQ